MSSPSLTFSGEVALLGYEFFISAILGFHSLPDEDCSVLA
jgi:hypothetical protein